MPPMYLGRNGYLYIFDVVIFAEVYTLCPEVHILYDTYGAVWS